MFNNIWAHQWFEWFNSSLSCAWNSTSKSPKGNLWRYQVLVHSSLQLQKRSLININCRDWPVIPHNFNIYIHYFSTIIKLWLLLILCHNYKHNFKNHPNQKGTKIFIYLRCAYFAFKTQIWPLLILKIVNLTLNIFWVFIFIFNKERIYCFLYIFSHFWK